MLQASLNRCDFKPPSTLTLFLTHRSTVMERLLSAGVIAGKRWKRQRGMVINFFSPFLWEPM